MQPRLAALGLFVAGLLLCGEAGAQERLGRDEAGRFDFYVLALSWSPSYCEDRRGQADTEQCESGRPYAFVVHGLWPQNERGWPEDCRRDRAVPSDIAEAMLPLMPSRDLIDHEWRRHGTCSGLPVAGYFDQVRQARERVRIPAPFERLQRALRTSPERVEAAFIAANPGLSDDGVAVICRGGRVSEVRICMDKGLGFRACADVDRRSCRRQDLVMPPVRGGS